MSHCSSLRLVGNMTNNIAARVTLIPDVTIRTESGNHRRQSLNHPVPEGATDYLLMHLSAPVTLDNARLMPIARDVRASGLCFSDDRGQVDYLWQTAIDAKNWAQMDKENGPIKPETVDEKGVLPSVGLSSANPNRETEKCQSYKGFLYPKIQYERTSNGLKGRCPPVDKPKKGRKKGAKQ